MLFLYKIFLVVLKSHEIFKTMLMKTEIESDRCNAVAAKARRRKLLFKIFGR